MCCCWQLVRQLRQSLLERTLDTRSVSITPLPPPPPTPPPPLLHPHKQKSESDIFCQKQLCHKLISIHDMVVTFWSQTFQANFCLWFPSQRELLNKFWASKMLTLSWVWQAGYKWDIKCQGWWYRSCPAGVSQHPSLGIGHHWYPVLMTSADLHSLYH